MKRLEWKELDGIMVLQGSEVSIILRQGYVGEIFQLMYQGRNYGMYWELEMALIDGARLAGDGEQAYERAAAMI